MEISVAHVSTEWLCFQVELEFGKIKIKTIHYILNKKTAHSIVPSDLCKYHIPNK